MLRVRSAPHFLAPTDIGRPLLAGLVGERSLTYAHTRILLPRNRLSPDKADVAPFGADSEIYMALVKRKDFLASRRFTRGEFETLQGQLESHIERFAGTLVEPIGRSLRAQLSGDLARQYASSAVAALDSLLTVEHQPGTREAAGAVLAQRLRAELFRSPALDELELEQEVQSCSREMAQLVLARWLEKLNHSQPSSAGVKLNANLLPGTVSVEDTLSGIDFESHGVEKLVVVNGLRTYWDELVNEALQNKKPIELGRQLLIVPEKSIADQPYLLFGDRAAAEARMARTQTSVPATVAVPEAPESRYFRILDMVRNALVAKPMQLDRALALGVYKISQMSKHTNGLVLWNLDQASDMLFVDGGSPERALADSVERGVDLVIAGLAGGPQDAIDLLSSDEYAIAKQLQEYAVARTMPLAAVNDAFAMAVCVGIQYQPMRNVGFEVVLQDIGFDVHKRFAETYKVTEASATQVMNASFAGSAYATPGVAFW